jgi:hypothetical protein
MVIKKPKENRYHSFNPDSLANKTPLITRNNKEKNIVMNSKLNKYDTKVISIFTSESQFRLEDRKKGDRPYIQSTIHILFK